jgi:hypothetical protein
MLPKATLEHATPRRLRMKVAELRGDAPYFRSVIDKLSGQPGIAALRANPLTGSILIEHDTDVSSIRRIAAERDLFELDEEPARRLLPGSSMSGGRGRQSSNGGAAEFDGRKAAVTGLTGLAAYRAMSGHLVAPATDDFWHAFHALRTLNNPFLALLLGGLGVLQLTRGKWAGSASSLLFYALVIRQMSNGRPERGPTRLPSPAVSKKSSPAPS